MINFPEFCGGSNWCSGNFCLLNFVVQSPLTTFTSLLERDHLNRRQEGVRARRRRLIINPHEFYIAAKKVKLLTEGETHWLFIATKK